MGAQVVFGNREGCICVASLLVVVQEDNTSVYLGAERMVQGQ